MPELPEVRVSSKSINNNVENKTIIDVIVLKEKLIKEISDIEFKEKLIGNKILKVDNYGKFIVFHLSNDLIMLSHLRMEGSYHSLNENEELLKHDHIIFKLNDGSALVYNDSRMFGTFHLRTKDNYLSTLPLSKMAKEPQNTDPKELMKVFSKKSISIKSALLDQTILVGLGNIYVNEVLFKCRISPTRKSKEVSLSEIKDLLKVSQEVMDKSTSMGGTTIKSYVSFNDKEGGYQDLLLMHGKTNEPCPGCLKKIVKTKVNGRGTYSCTKCQK